MWHWDHLGSQNCKIAHKGKSLVGKTKRKVRVRYILVDRVWNMKYWNSVLIATLNTSGFYQMWLYGIQKCHKSFWGVSWSGFFPLSLGTSGALCIVKRFICCTTTKEITWKNALTISLLSPLSLGEVHLQTVSRGSASPISSLATQSWCCPLSILHSILCASSSFSLSLCSNVTVSLQSSMPLVIVPRVFVWCSLISPHQRGAELKNSQSKCSFFNLPHNGYVQEGLFAFFEVKHTSHKVIHCSHL